MAAENLNIVIRAFNKTQGVFNAVGRGLNGVKKRVLNVKTAVAGLAGAAGFGLFIKSTIETNRKFQSLEASLQTFLGSSKKAASAFSVLQEFAAKTPFSLQEIVGAFNRLISVGLNPSISALEAFGNIASGTGKTLEQFVEAAADAAVGEFERLKEFGIKARSEGSKVIFTFKGVETEIAKDAESIEGYLRTLGKTEFSGAIARQADTLNGAFSNLGDAFDAFQVLVGKAGLNEAINDFAVALGNLVRNSPDFAEAIGKTLGDAVTKLTGILELGEGGVKQFALTIAAEFLNAAFTAVQALDQLAAAAAKIPGVGKIDFSKSLFGLAEMIEKFRAAAAAAGSGKGGLTKSVGELDAALQIATGSGKDAGKTIREMLGFSKAQAEDTASVIGDSFGEAFMKLSEGAMSAKDAFKQMARDIIKRLYEILVVEQLVSSITGEVTKGFNTTAPAKGVSNTAIGGSVQRGVPRMVGERGKEIFVPHSAGSIVPNNELGGDGGATVVQNINISTGVSQTVRAEITQLMPQIAEASKAAVLDARRRGGSFSKAF